MRAICICISKSALRTSNGDGNLYMHLQICIYLYSRGHLQIQIQIEKPIKTLRSLRHVDLTGLVGTSVPIVWGPPPFTNVLRALARPRRVALDAGLPAPPSLFNTPPCHDAAGAVGGGARDRSRNQLFAPGRPRACALLPQGLSMRDRHGR